MFGVVTKRVNTSLRGSFQKSLQSIVPIESQYPRRIYRVSRRYASHVELRTQDVGQEIPLMMHKFQLGMVLVVAIPAVAAYIFARRNNRIPLETEGHRLTNVIASLPKTEFATRTPLSDADADNESDKHNDGSGVVLESDGEILAEEEESVADAPKDPTLESCINAIAAKTLESSQKISQGKTVYYFAFDSDMEVTAFSKRSGMVAMNTQRGILPGYDLYVCADNEVCVKKGRMMMMDDENDHSVLHNSDGVHGIIYEFDQKTFSRLFCGSNRIKSMRLSQALTQMVEKDDIPLEMAVQSLFRVESIRVYNEDRTYPDAGIDDHIQCVLFDQSAFFAEEARQKRNNQNPGLSLHQGSAIIVAGMGGNLDPTYRRQLMNFVQDTKQDSMTDITLSKEEIRDNVSVELSKLNESIPRLSMNDICDRKDVCICKGYALQMKDDVFVGNPDWAFAKDVTLKIAAESSLSTLPSLLSVNNLSNDQHDYINQFIVDCANGQSEFATIIGQIN